MGFLILRFLGEYDKVRLEENESEVGLLCLVLRILMGFVQSSTIVT